MEETDVPVDPNLVAVVISCLTGQDYQTTYDQRDEKMSEVEEDDREHVRNVEKHILDRYTLPAAVNGGEDRLVQDRSPKDPDPRPDLPDQAKGQGREKG